jgi:rsbT co-antagonist protein RsbR
VFAAAQLGVTDLIFRIGPDDKEDLRRIIKGLSALFDAIVQMVGRTYFDAHQRALDAETRRRLDVSTPVLETEPGMLLVPLVGQLDAQRGERLRSAVLEAVRARRASHVVIDLTGVGAVDDAAVTQLHAVVEAARLMGGRVLLSGLSAEVCYALVALGVDLGVTHTFPSLEEALDTARRSVGSARRTVSRGSASAK